jgi:hypothetical protein
MLSNVTDFFIIFLLAVVLVVEEEDADVDVLVLLSPRLTDVTEVPSNCTTDRGDCCVREDLRITERGGVAVFVFVTTLLVLVLLSFSIGCPVVLVLVSIDGLKGLEHMLTVCYRLLLLLSDGCW